MDRTDSSIWGPSKVWSGGAPYAASAAVFPETERGSRTDLGGVHHHGGDKVEENVVAVGANAGVAGGHLQLIHGLQEQPLALVLQVLEGGFLGGKTEEEGEKKARLVNQPWSCTPRE